MDEPRNELLDGDLRREQAAERLRLIQLENDEDLRVIMGTQHGRRWMWRHLDRCGMWRASFVENREGTDFREGERNTALRLWADLQRACPETLLRMQKENRT